MNHLIEKVRQWGIDKGITGPHGKGTPSAQVVKMLEEAGETAAAVSSLDHAILCNYDKTDLIKEKLLEVKDGIGDTCVTLILLAELHYFTLEECLDHAYQIIAKRTGKMEGGTFVKDS